MSNLFPESLCTVFDLRAGDCLGQLQTIGDGTIDVVVTSPPYNLDIAYGTFRDDAPRGGYLDWCLKWAAEIERTLKPDGSFFLNVGASPANPMLPHELVLKLQPLFQLQNTIHWIKAITVQPRGAPELSVGHFKPINSKRFLTDCHEYVFHLSKEARVPLDRLAVGVEYSDKSNIARWSHTGGADRRCRGNTWFIPYPTIRSRKTQRPHPATFPVQLAERCLRLHGIRPGMTVLDPFLGIGHAAQAAAACSVEKFIGIEIDASYLAEARERLGLNPST